MSFVHSYLKVFKAKYQMYIKKMSQCQKWCAKYFQSSQMVGFYVQSQAVTEDGTGSTQGYS